MHSTPSKSGTPRKRKLASSSTPLRAWNHILENNTPLNNNSRRRSPIKAVRPTHIEHSSRLDAYDALERGVRELLLSETTSEIGASSPCATRQENTCIAPLCGEPSSSAEIMVQPAATRSVPNPISPLIPLQPASPPTSPSKIRVRRRRLLSDSDSESSTSPQKSLESSPIITRAPLQQSLLPNATVPPPFPSPPPSTPGPLIPSSSKIRVVRGRVESDSESSDGEVPSSIPSLHTRSLNAIPAPPITRDVSVGEPSPLEHAPSSGTKSQHIEQTQSTSSQNGPQVIDISSEESSHSSSECDTTLEPTPSSTQVSSSILPRSETSSTLIDDPPAVSKQFLFPYQSPSKKWTDGLSSPVKTSTIANSDSERSEYSSNAGVLTLDLPRGYRRPCSPMKRAIPQKQTLPNTQSVPFYDEQLHMPGTFPYFSAASPAELGGAIISIHSDSDEDDGGVGIRRPVPRAGKRRGKRMSVWSVMDQAEVITISSSSSSGNDSDNDDIIRRKIPVPLLRPPFKADSSTPKSQSRSTPRKNIPAAPPPSGRTLQKSTAVSVSATTIYKKRPRPNKAHLMAYALELYTSLNAHVFGNRLPPGYSAPSQEDEGEREMCEIVWSKTLSTTAGRAITKRGERFLPDGQRRRKIMIELATKVVDSDERVRHTLSHEMCHLAVWLVDQGKDGGHGRAFKVWAARVMKVRKDIEITSTHAYQITYKFEWKCKSCGQVYGRHGKSINPADQRCGVCKGELLALFEDSKSTGWGAFLKERLQSFKASRPELSHGEAMKELGKIWREREAGDGVGVGGAKVDALASELMTLGL